MNPQPTMPFGRHKGAPLEALPTSYLSWLTGLETLHDPLKTSVVEELARRELEARAAPPAMEDVQRAAVNIVKMGYHELAKKSHPDRGGTHAQMVNLNLAYRTLVAKLDSLTP